MKKVEKNRFFYKKSHFFMFFGDFLELLKKSPEKVRKTRFFAAPLNFGTRFPLVYDKKF